MIEPGRGAFRYQDSSHAPRDRIECDQSLCRAIELTEDPRRSYSAVSTGALGSVVAAPSYQVGSCRPRCVFCLLCCAISGIGLERGALSLKGIRSPTAGFTGERLLRVGQPGEHKHPRNCGGIGDGLVTERLHCFRSSDY